MPIDMVYAIAAGIIADMCTMCFIEVLFRVLRIEKIRDKFDR